MENLQNNNKPMAQTARDSRRAIISLKAKALMERTWLQACADWLAGSFGTVWFLIFNAVWFSIWIIFNSGIFKQIAPFDPFPFSFLTMTVSLEAIFLSIIVLMSQNRATRLDELRQEIDLQLDTISEKEITKIMQMLVKIMEHHKLDTSNDTVLREMLKPTDTKKIEDDLNRQM